jgi:hypothetical protein
VNEPEPQRLQLLDDRSAGRIGFSVTRWLDPLPPSLVEHLPAEERARHDELIARYEKAQQRAAELVTLIEQDRAADHERTLAAVEAGRKPPPDRAAKLEAELGQLRRSIAALSELIPGSCQRLLDAVSAHVEAARDEAYSTASAVLPSMRELVAALQTELDRVGRALGEGRWLSQLAARRHQPPFQPASNLGRLGDVQRVVRELDVVLAAALEHGVVPDVESEPVEQADAAVQLRDVV